MLGAIYIGLSGMSAYSRGLQTISNNVANLNTLGFKATTVNFADTYNTGGRGLGYASGARTDLGGGGVRFGASQISFDQGDLRATTGDLDLAIKGDGFLVLQDGGRTYYARTGQFTVDDSGYIALADGKRLSVLGADGRPTALNIDAKRTQPPVATTQITFSDNLSSTALSASVSSINVYDSNGGKQVWQVAFTPDTTTTPTTGTSQWTVKVTDQTGATVGTSTLKFTGGIVDPATTKLVITNAPAGADPLSVTLDFSQGVTSFSSGTSSSLRASAVNGSAAGSLSAVTVDADGQVKLTYSNGRTAQAGAVVLADFSNPQQLERVGEGLFEYKGSGQTRLVASGAEGVGTVVAKQLEASNVDLSQEFGDLILIQRGFQASSQVVSVSNDMIQQLFGIRGQG